MWVVFDEQHTAQQQEEEEEEEESYKAQLSRMEYCNTQTAANEGIKSDILVAISLLFFLLLV